MTDVELEVRNASIEKLKGKLYGLLREHEKGGEWEKFLDTISLELYGFPEERKTINYMFVCYKVAALRYLNMYYFRKTIFEAMNLLETVKYKSGDE